MKSLLVVQIQEAVWRKLNILKPLFSRKKSLTFQKRSKKMLSHQRANLADQPINNNRRKLIYVSRPLVMKQTFDRHMSKMFDQPSQSGLLTSGLFKILEFLQAFPFFPSTSPFFLSFFFLLFFFFFCFRSIYRAAKNIDRKSRSSVFLFSQKKRKRLLRRRM